VRDFAQVRANGVITAPVAEDALSRLDVDPLGLDETDRRLLHAIIEKFGGGPVGIDTVAASISEESDTVEDVYEPFLIQLGFLQRERPGRHAHLAAMSNER
jgi:Holliday junction DNA helicase RuvB